MAKRRGARREHAHVASGAAAGAGRQINEDFAVGRPKEQELVRDSHRAQGAAGAIDGGYHVHALHMEGTCKYGSNKRHKTQKNEHMNSHASLKPMTWCLRNERSK